MPNMEEKSARNRNDFPIFRIYRKLCQVRGVLTQGHMSGNCGGLTTTAGKGAPELGDSQHFKARTHAQNVASLVQKTLSEIRVTRI